MGNTKSLRETNEPHLRNGKPPTGIIQPHFDSNDSVMEAEDDSVLDLNLVSFRSEIHPLILDSLGDSLGSSDFCSQPTVRGRLKFGFFYGVLWELRSLYLFILVYTCLYLSLFKVTRLSSTKY